MPDSPESEQPVSEVGKVGDKDTKDALRKWPTILDDFANDINHDLVWQRAQPVDQNGDHNQGGGSPNLAMIDSGAFKTQPDGLWVALKTDGQVHIADCIVVEACGTIQNFRDKRSRVRPTTSTVVLTCPKAWLNKSVEAVPAGTTTPR